MFYCYGERKEERISGAHYSAWIALDTSEASDDLAKRLRVAAKQSLTPEEARAQSISFAMGMLPHNSTTTREFIESLAERQYGKLPA